MPAILRHLDAEHSIIADVLADHDRIRRLAQEVLREDSSMHLLRRLGDELEQHVRREEQELFPLLEQTLPEAELRRLRELLGSC